MEAKVRRYMCSETFFYLSGSYIFMFNYSHAFYFIYMCIICPKLIEYVEMKEL